MPQRLGSRGLPSLFRFRAGSLTIQRKEFFRTTATDHPTGQPIEFLYLSHAVGRLRHRRDPLEGRSDAEKSLDRTGLGDAGGRRVRSDGVGPGTGLSLGWSVPPGWFTCCSGTGQLRRPSDLHSYCSGRCFPGRISSVHGAMADYLAIRARSRLNLQRPRHLVSRDAEPPAKIQNQRRVH